MRTSKKHLGGSLTSPIGFQKKNSIARARCVMSG
jgi:hypothetical protein